MFTHLHVWQLAKDGETIKMIISYEVKMVVEKVDLFVLLFQQTDRWLIFKRQEEQ